MNARKQKSRIPVFKSLDEAADFWDKHDTTDFEDEFKEVDLRFAQPLIHVLEVELDSKSINRLFALAESKGVNPIDLVRSWISERVGQAQ
jgi:hypothetical protein